MPYITIKIANAGTPLTTGGQSSVGHMWFTLSNGPTSQSYGFAPDEQHHGNPFAPGQVYTTDDAVYSGAFSERIIEISDSQYNAIRDFASDPSAAGFSTRYNGITNSCIDFTWKALEAGGLNPSNYNGAVWPTWNRDYVQSVWDQAKRSGSVPRDWDIEISIDTEGRATVLPICRPPHGTTSSSVHDAWRAGLTPPRPPGDPLAIDLDGDGLETVGIGATPILFDHNADGIKTGTGWVKGDDAWLVLDRNGNGLIDSGRELFGVDTLITNPNGSVRAALDGFEALRTLDVGNGTPGSAGNADGVFNASDAAFTQMRLWQDLNQDGISQGSELFSLAQRNITSIGLTPTGGSTNLGNGNTVTGHSTVTYTNGSTIELDSVAVSTEASNLDLALNPFYREFTDAVPLTEAAQALPEMGGSGVVRDLREAMSLGNAAAAALVASVQAFAAGSTRAAQQAALDELLHDWAATEAISDRFDIEAVGQETRRFVVNGSSDAALQAQLARMIPVLEVFNGRTVDESGWASTTSTVNGQTIRTYTIASQQATSMLAAYDGLRSSVYSALAVQTRLKPYLDSVELVIDENDPHRRFVLDGDAATSVRLRAASNDSLWRIAV
ncbi:hypothetical protein [Methylibium sp.]|uniref:hypothetical protein n=1 Tax=Methylibium sp. TaxID=2067992 RepID=UPI003D12024C